jgi:hypothetical protein
VAALSSESVFSGDSVFAAPPVFWEAPCEVRGLVDLVVAFADDAFFGLVDALFLVVVLLLVVLAVDFSPDASAVGASAVVELVDPPERPRPRPLPPRRRRRGLDRGSSDSSPALSAGESRASSVIP